MKILKLWFSALIGLITEPKKELDYEECKLKIKNHKHNNEKIKSLTNDDWL